jgi:hypothetical protein
VSRPALDWSDPVAVSRWLAGLRLAFDDADGIALDMLEPPRSRELGPVLHADTYGKARAQILQALDFATAPEPEGEGGDPAGFAHRGAHHARRLQAPSVRPFTASADPSTPRCRKVAGRRPFHAPW